VFVIELQSRRVHVAGSTPYPDDAFVVQACAASRTVDGVLADGCVLICARDRKWSRAVLEFLEQEGVRIVRTPFRAPNCNAYAERFVRSIKKEARAVHGSRAYSPTPADWWRVELLLPRRVGRKRHRQSCRTYESEVLEETRSFRSLIQINHRLFVVAVSLRSEVVRAGDPKRGKPLGRKDCQTSPSATSLSEKSSDAFQISCLEDR
jgi:hypothetical protein